MGSPSQYGGYVPRLVTEWKVFAFSRYNSTGSPVGHHCPRTRRSSPGESPRLVPNIRISVSAVYRQGLRAVGLKAALSKTFSAIQNRKELETRFYASQPRQNQEPTDFVYDLLKLQKKLDLEMLEKALVIIFLLDLNHKCRILWKCETHKTWFNSWRSLLNLRKDIHARQYEVLEIVITWKDQVLMSVGCLMLVIIQEIGEILKWCVDREMVEMIIGVTTRIAVKKSVV
ncbi:uncharacterized protein TNCV_241471 [Trichonephila clavipes]|uniref:Uncharacterized protein n=1 Tax=Trichonephila clavipes TaxID=2585209 RepID=A0A8X7BEH6_TRICX|nr:uncharacterized protein TNCV_241471 [Trichonephila clavipes]